MAFVALCSPFCLFLFVFCAQFCSEFFFGIYFERVFLVRFLFFFYVLFYCFYSLSCASFPSSLLVILCYCCVSQRIEGNKILLSFPFFSVAEAYCVQNPKGCPSSWCGDCTRYARLEHVEGKDRCSKCRVYVRVSSQPLFSLSTSFLLRRFSLFSLPFLWYLSVFFLLRGGFRLSSSLLLFCCSFLFPLQSQSLSFLCVTFFVFLLLFCSFCCSLSLFLEEN